MARFLSTLLKTSPFKISKLFSLAETKILYVTLLPAMLFFGAQGTEAADRYVRAGATGANNGTDWNNAYSTLPATLVRSDTYYIADGNYGSYTFDDPVSGTTLITLKKATIADHGTNTGWSDTYGDGQASFGSLFFATDYWSIDGQKRNESDWFECDAYGIATNSIETNVFVHGHAADNVTLRYIDIGADCGSTFQESYGDGVYLGGFSETVENWLLHRVHIHNVIVAGQHAGVHNITYEYSAIGPNWSKTGVRHQIRGSSVTFRYNIFRNACQGTPNDPTATSCTAIIGWYGNAGSNNEDYSNSAVYGNLFIDTIGTNFYSDAVILMGDDRTLQGGGPMNCSGCRIFNNTFVGMGRLDGSSQVGFKFLGNILNTEARNNIWYNIGNKTAFCLAVACSNNPKITNANIFVNAGAENFQLSSNGAAGAGNALGSSYNTDMLGKTRGTDGVWDLGAFEFTAGNITRPAAPTGLQVQ